MIAWLLGAVGVAGYIAYRKWEERWVAKAKAQRLAEENLIRRAKAEAVYRADREARAKKAQEAQEAERWMWDVLESQDLARSHKERQRLYTLNEWRHMLGLPALPPRG